MGSLSFKAVRTTAAALALGGVLAGAVGTVYAAGVEDTVKARQDKMKELGGHMKAIKAFADGGGDAADIAARAQAMREIAVAIPEWFPADSLMGTDGLSVETRALPAIAEKRAEFEKIAAVLAEEAGKLAQVAQAGDNGAVGAQFGVLGKESCGACHKAFQQPR